MFDEPTRLQRFYARHKTALRSYALVVALVACGAAAWIIARGSDLWFLFVAAVSVLNVYTVWPTTKTSDRLVRDHEEKAARDR